MQTFFLVLVLSFGPLVVVGQGSCKEQCNSVVGELPQALDCRSYRMMLPRPKVGRACTSAYDDGALTACLAACSAAEVPQKDGKSAEFCRKFITDYPKPTVHKACRTGYSLGFDKGLKAFSDKKEAQSVEAKEEQPPPMLQQEEKKQEPAAEKKNDVVAPEKKEVTKEEEKVQRKLLVTMPVTVDEEEIHLEIFDDADPEAQLDAFCGQHMSDSHESCVRQLTPHLQRKLQKA